MLLLSLLVLLVGLTVPRGAAAQQITLGGGHSCAVLQDGSVKCWGLNGDGQLGLNDTETRGDETDEMGANLSEVLLDADESATQLIGDRYHTCAVLDTNDLKCWGRNSSGQLGLGGTDNQGDEAGEMGALDAVSLGTGRTPSEGGSGYHHTCAILDNDALKCWGQNSYGQLGLGDTENRGDQTGEMGDNLSTVDLGTGRTATQIVGGQGHTCAVLDDGSVKCWGNNLYGQLGLGDTQTRGDGEDKDGNPANEMGDNLSTVGLGTGRTAVSLAAGAYYTCAILDNGSVKCWGANGYGQLGQGDTDHRGNEANEMGDNLPPVDLGTGRTATRIIASDQTTCALLDDGSVKCWGANGFGQLGQGDTDNRGDEANEMGDNLPVVPLDGSAATQLGAGAEHFCAVLDDASIKCWGRNDLGMLGLEDTNNRGDEASEMGTNLSPVELDGQALPVELAAFTVRQNGSGARLTWRTASETNNAGFRVQHQRDGETSTWRQIGAVDGAGTTTKAQHYRFRVEDLTAGTHRFRLKQIDTDGSANYSDPVDLQIGIEGAYRLVAPAPNPTAGHAQIHLTVQETQPVRVTVYDLLGRAVETAFDRTLSAQNEETIRVGQALPTGTYMVRVQGTQFRATERLSIVR